MQFASCSALQKALLMYKYLINQRINSMILFLYSRLLEFEFTPNIWKMDLLQGMWVRWTSISCNNRTLFRYFRVGFIIILKSNASNSRMRKEEVEMIDVVIDTIDGKQSHATLHMSSDSNSDSNSARYMPCLAILNRLLPVLNWPFPNDFALVTG